MGGPIREFVSPRHREHALGHLASRVVVAHLIAELLGVAERVDHRQRVCKLLCQAERISGDAERSLRTTSTPLRAREDGSDSRQAPGSCPP